MVLKYGFKGLMAPVFTCFESTPGSSLELNLDLIPKYAEYMKSKGVTGILVNGTTGEHVLMTVEERRAVTEAWLDETRKHQQTMMVQIGGASLPSVLSLAKHAEAIKVPGILCLPDLFFRPKTVSELINYLKAVSKAAPNTPLFYYHIPVYTGVNLSMSDFLKEGMKKIPTLSGIKFTCNDLDEGAKCLNIHDDYTIFLGADKIFSAAVVLGFDSAIMTTLNFWPEDFREIISLLKIGKVEEAKAIQSRITESFENILCEGNFIVQMKSHMVNEIGLPVGFSRLSLLQH